MKKLGHYLKRGGGAAALVAIFAAVFLNTSADDIRLLSQIDNNYESIMLVSENNSLDTVVVNINTATVHHLQRIDGIGETCARAIVEYREEHGGFKSVDELENVSGIGRKTLESIRDLITV